MDGRANNRDLNGDTGNPSGDAANSSGSAILGIRFTDGSDATDTATEPGKDNKRDTDNTNVSRESSLSNSRVKRTADGNAKLSQRERNRINNRRYRERKRAEQRGEQDRDRGNSDGDRAGSSENDNTISFDDFEQAVRDLGSAEESETPPRGVDFSSLLGDDNQSFKKVLRDPKLINIGGAAIDALFSGLVALGAGEHWRLAGNECEALAKSWIAVLETTVVGKKKKNLEKWVAKRLPLGTALLVTVGIFYPRFNAEWEAYKRSREVMTSDTKSDNTDGILGDGQQAQQPIWGEKNGFRRFGG